MTFDQNFVLRAILDNFPGGISVMDRDLRLVFVNPEAKRILGFPESLFADEAPLLETLFRYNAARGEYGPGDLEEQVATRMELARERQPHAFERERPDGTVVEIRGVPVEGGGFVTTYVDVTEQRRNQARIAHMARHDPLTDLANRVLFREQVEEALKRVRRGESIAVLCLDLDHFKAVNDTLGHPVGDSLLQSVATRLRDSLREIDAIARLGGDEFAIVEVGSSQPEGATVLARRVIEALGEPYDIDGHHVVTGISIGVAVAPTDGTDADQLLKNADIALYRAKSDGRGTYRFFEPEMDARMQARRALELDLRQALLKDEFTLFYQPIVNLETQAVTGCEALLRWPHAQRGMVMPADFIPLAEEIGLIVPIGEWVLCRACRDAATWPEGTKVAVNLSPAQFRSKNLLAAVTEALAASGLAPHRLELEITEGVLLVDQDSTLALLHELRRLGVTIAMDDFGTGYSSLSYLRSFPFDRIKIDGSFIRAISDEESSLAIIRAVTGLSASLGIETTAEGVETAKQLDHIRAEGCTDVQGFLFSAARPADEVRDLLVAGNMQVEAAE